MTISLKKNQTVSLKKPSGAGLTQIAMGLGWTGIEKKKGLFGLGGGREAVDLDANALLFAGQTLQDAVWFGQLQSRAPGAVTHTGDNRTGDGDGDDETINVDLTRIPANITCIVFTVNNYSGQAFNRVQEARCRVIDMTSKEVVATFDITEAGGQHTGLVMAKLTRDGQQWKLTSIGETVRGSGRTGETFHDNLPQILRHL